MSRVYNVSVRARTDRNGHMIDSLDFLIRKFKKKCEKAQVLEDMKKKEFYVSKSQKIKIKKKLANQRRLKEAAKYAERFPDNKGDK